MYLVSSAEGTLRSFFACRGMQYSLKMYKCMNKNMEYSFKWQNAQNKSEKIGIFVHYLSKKGLTNREFECIIIHTFNQAASPTPRRRLP